MKLDKLLRNNTFLISSGVYLIILLIICYLGLNSPVKNTYSVSMGECYITEDGTLVCPPDPSEYELYGEYRFNDGTLAQFKFDDNTEWMKNYNGSTDAWVHSVDIDIIYNSKTYKRMGVFYWQYNDYQNVFLKEDKSATEWGNFPGDESIATLGENHTTIFNNTNLLNVTSPTSVNERFYNWFVANTTPVNKCYLNKNLGKYYWSSIPATGDLQESITSQTDCENKNNTYTVTYNMNGGSGGPTNQTKNHSVPLTLNTTQPTKTGHNFTGWNTNKDGTGTSYSPGGNYTADADVTLYAQWKLEEYTVTYNANNGSNLSKNSDTVEYNSSVTLPSVSRSGYTFKGWYTAASGGTKVGGAGASYTVTKEITLYAQWTQNIQTYKVTFNGNGGTAAKDNVSVESGKETTLPTATRDGYDFQGWYTEATGGTKVGGAGESYKVTKSITLYAQWKEQEVSIDFGDYKDNVKDDYIIVDLGTKKTDFEGNIKFSITGYKASVEDKDGLLYTSGKLKILKSDNSVYKEYLIVVLYDLDGDGEVTTMDYMLLYKYLAEELKVEESGLKYFKAAADINKDGTLTTMDYMLIHEKLKEAV